MPMNPPDWSQLGRVHHLQQVVGRRSHPQQRRQQWNNIRQFVKQLADLWELRLQRVKQALNLRIDSLVAGLQLGHLPRDGGEERLHLREII